MILHDELIYLIEHRYPQLKHGRDFWVAQKIDPKTGVQLADAEILEWLAEGEPPNVAELIESFGALKDAFLAEQARAMRDALIAKTDWTQLTDIQKATQQRWRPYRQALRDVPQQEGFPQKIAWPAPPESARKPAPEPEEPPPPPQPLPDKPHRPGKPPPIVSPDASS